MYITMGSKMYDLGPLHPNVLYRHTARIDVEKRYTLVELLDAYAYISNGIVKYKAYKYKLSLCMVFGVGHRVRK